MIDEERPAHPTVLHAGTRPVPQSGRYIVGSGRSVMIGVLTAIAVLVVLCVVAAAALGVYGYRAYRDEQRRTSAVSPAPVPRVVPRKGLIPVSPIGNQGEWFPADAYPPEARRRGEQGRVSVSLSIDGEGRVTGCTVMVSSGSAILDAQTCNLARRNARFSPARQDGVGIPSTYQLRGVRWQLDPDAGMRVEAVPRVLVDQIVEVSLSPTGAVTHCKVIRKGVGNADPCAAVPIGRVMFSPPMRNGRPTTARMRIGNTLTLLPPE